MKAYWKEISRMQLSPKHEKQFRAATARRKKHNSQIRTPAS
jgi:hypothetical protein